MASLKKTDEAFEKLKTYSGENPYILRLKNDVYKKNNIDVIKDLQVEYILSNFDKKIKPINKIIKVADWYAEKKKGDWQTEFLPEKIKIISLLGETDLYYHCFVQYRKSVEPFMLFIPKKAVLTNFLIEDYSKVAIDFDRYEKLSIANSRRRTLFEHQKTAVQFLISRKKCILADSMGLGKTTALSVAAIEGNFDSVLIICPASLKTTWRNELMCYVPEKDITVIEGFVDKTKGELEKFLGYSEGKSKLTRAELLNEAKERGKWQHNRFVIINYDIVDEFFKNKRTYNEAQFNELLSNNPMLEYINNRKSLIIIDEAHSLSDSKSIRYKTIRGLIKKGKPESIYLATGTPITNNPSNLYSVLSLLDDPITSEWDYYMKRYCNAKEFCVEREKRNKLSIEWIKKRGKRTWYDLTKEEKEALDNYLHKNCRYVLSPQGESNLEELKERISHIYLRRENNILKLPEKHIHEIYYELTPEQKNKYNNLWDEYEATHSEEGKELNQSLLEGAVYRQYLSNEMIPYTIELAEKFISNNEKVVIACCYDEELYSLQEYYGEKCVIYNGKMSLKQKDEAIDKFMNNPDVMVFIGNIKAASMGITLISSHIVIFSDFDYVPALDFQMEDRVHRIGQTEECHIYYQIFKNTQYEKMINIVRRKNDVITQVIKTEDEK